MKWHAIRVITGREFAVLDKLNERLSEVYIPTYTTNSRPGKARKAKKITRPRFTGYVFARCGDNSWPAVKDIRHVCGFICDPNGKPYRIKDEMVEQWRREEAMGVFDDDGIAGKVRPGDLLDVLGGPFGGARIAFFGVKGDMIQTEIELLGAKRTVQIPARDVSLAS